MKLCAGHMHAKNYIIQFKEKSRKEYKEYRFSFGTRSALLRISTNFLLPGAALTARSTSLQRVPKGSRASTTSRTTSVLKQQRPTTTAFASTPKVVGCWQK
uniref:Uncharacterized protein n=1 Tax=Glossina morsitans morsitans TaxID=37546 RepID=A0A1B0GBX8_GLOMM